MMRTTAELGSEAATTGLGTFDGSMTTRLPATRERLGPWLATAIVAGVTLGVLLREGGSLTSVRSAALVVACSSALAAAGLVAARSQNVREDSEREERSRPAREQLVDLDEDGPGTGAGSPSYVQGMERWTTALLDLLVHAAEVTTDPERGQELLSAVEDTEALRSLLRSSAGRELNLSEAATLRSVCMLWETDQERIEQLAADVDPAWHRRWRARAVVERLLRHGSSPRAELVLPYRS